MPALETVPRPVDACHPALGHVNLMADTLIANVALDDLRSIVRNMLASGTPGVAAAFTSAARARLQRSAARALSSSYPLFTRDSYSGDATPTPHLSDNLAQARFLYGAGMGLTSLKVLAAVVRATIGLQWTAEGEMADTLAMIDADIDQGIQSSKEELEAGRVADGSSARTVVNDLRSAIRESFVDVKAWGGEFPFERASAGIDYWRL